MTVAPTKSLSLVLDSLGQTVAAAANFQAVIATGGLVESTDSAYTAAVQANDSAAAALAKILWHETDEHDDSQAPPRAILRYLHDDEIERVAVATWESAGPLSLVFEFPEPTSLAAAPVKDRLVDFTNKVGAIVADMQALAQRGPYLNAVRFQMREIGRFDPDENNGVAGWGAWYFVFYRGM